MEFLEYVRNQQDSDLTLRVVNRQSPTPLLDKLKSLFEGQEVDVE